MQRFTFLIILCLSLLFISGPVIADDESDSGSPQFLIESRPLPAATMTAGPLPATIEAPYQTELLTKEEVLSRQVEALKNIQTQLNREMEEQRGVLSQTQSDLLSVMNDNAALTKKLRSQSQRNEEIDQEEITLRQEIIEVNRKLNHVMKDYEALRREKIVLEEKMNSQNTSDATLADQIKALKAENQELEKEMQAKLAKETQLKGESRDAQKRMAVLKDEMAVKRQAHADELEKIRQELALNVQNQQTLQNKNAVLERQISHLRKNAGSLTQQVQALNDKNVQLRLKYESKEAQLSNNEKAIEMELQQTKREWEALRKLNNALTDDVEESRLRNNKLLDQVESLKAAQLELEAALAQETAKGGSRESDYKALQAKLTDSLKINRTLENNLQDLQRAQKDVELQLAAALSREKQHISQTTAIRDELKAVRAQNVSLKAKIEDLTQVRQKLQVSLEEVHREEAGAESAAAQLNKALEDKEALNQRLAADLKKLADEQEGLKQTLNQTLHQYELSQKRVTNLTRELQTAQKERQVLNQEIAAAQRTEKEWKNYVAELQGGYENERDSWSARQLQLEKRLAAQKEDLKQTRAIMMKGMTINTDLYETSRQSELRLKDVEKKSQANEARLAESLQQLSQYVAENKALAGKLERLTAERVVLYDQLTESQSNEESLAREIKDLRQTLAVNEVQSQELKENAEGMQTELKNALKQYADEKKARSQLELQTASLETKLTELNEAYQATEGRRGALEQELRQKTVEIEALRSGIQELKAAKHALEQGLSEVERETSSQIEDLKTQNQTLKNDLRAVSGRLDRKISNEKELKSLRQEHADLAVKYEAQAEALIEVQANYASSEQEKAGVQKKLAHSGIMAMEQKGRADALEDELTDSQVELSQTKAKADELRMSVTRLQAEKVAFKSNLESTLKDNWEVLKTAESLKRDFDLSKSYGQRLQSELSQLQVHHDAAVNQLNEQKKHLHETRTNEAIVKLSIAQTLRDYEDLRQSAAAKTKRLSQLEAEINRYQEAFTETRGKLEIAFNRSGELTEALENLENERIKTQEKINKLRGEYESEKKNSEALRLALTQRERETAKMAADYETHLESLQGENAALTKKYEESQADIASLKRARDEMAIAMEKEKIQLGQLQKSELTLTHRLDETTAELRKTEAELGNMNNLYLRLQEAESGITRTLRVLDKENDSLKSELAETKKNYTLLLEQMELKQASLGDEISGKTLQIHTLQNKVDALTEQRQTLALELGNLKEQVAQDKIAHDELVGQLQGQIGQQEGLLQERGARIQELETLNRGLNVQVEDLEFKIKNIRQQYDEVKSTLDLTNREYEKAVKERASLEIRLNTANRNEARMKSKLNRTELELSERQDILQSADQHQLGYESRLRTLKLQNTEMRDHLKQIDYIIQNTNGDSLKKNLVAIQSYSPTAREND